MANIRRKLTIYSGFILLESLVSFSIVCVIAGIFSLTITQLIQQNYQREQELTRTRLGYEAILFLEQTGDLRFKERIFDGERGKKDTKSDRFKRSDFDWSIKNMRVLQC